jgi:hypothetical protein
MKKLKLDLETLRVEAFAVEPGDLGGEGTVFGNSTSVGSYTEPYKYCLIHPETASCPC